MAFFENSFFQGEHFKARFYGGEFFQQPYFDGMTIAHGQSIRTVSTTTAEIVCSDPVTGTLSTDDFIVSIDGIAIATTDVTNTLEVITVTFSPAILDGDTVSLRILTNEANNVGEFHGSSLFEQPLVVKKRKPKKVT